MLVKTLIRVHNYRNFSPALAGVKILLIRFYFTNLILKINVDNLVYQTQNISSLYYGANPVIIEISKKILYAPPFCLKVEIEQ